MHWIAPWRQIGSVSRSVTAILITVLCLIALGACRRYPQQDWQLTNVDGHLPDLRFALTDDHGRPLTHRALRGKIAIVFFGYTHCPDICPTTLAKLSHILSDLGSAADRVRILFISVDPARDTPTTMHAYVSAFDARHAIGLSGADKQIEALAKRYRVAYAAEQRDPHGHYEVTHSGALYLFDTHGHARLIAGIDASSTQIAHDLRLLIATAPPPPFSLYG